jgi:hypothetical protein
MRRYLLKFTLVGLAASLFIASSSAPRLEEPDPLPRFDDRGAARSPGELPEASPMNGISAWDAGKTLRLALSPRDADKMDLLEDSGYAVWGPDYRESGRLAIIGYSEGGQAAVGTLVAIAEGRIATPGLSLEAAYPMGAPLNLGIGVPSLGPDPVAFGRPDYY